MCALWRFFAKFKDMVFKRTTDFRKKRLIQCVFTRMARGLSLIKASNYYGFKHTVALDWVAKYGLSDQYAKARESMYDVLAQEIEDVALMPIERKPDGALDPTALAQRRLQIEARRWYLGKVTKKYSDKTQVEHSGEITQNIKELKPFRRNLT